MKASYKQTLKYIRYEILSVLSTDCFFCFPSISKINFFILQRSLINIFCFCIGKTTLSFLQNIVLPYLPTVNEYFKEDLSFLNLTMKHLIQLTSNSGISMQSNITVRFNFWPIYCYGIGGLICAFLFK